MKLFWLFLFVLLPISVRGNGARLDQQKLKYLPGHETVTLTPRQIEEVDTLGTLTLEPGQWRNLRAKGVHCPLRFDTVVDVNCEAIQVDSDPGEFVVSLTPTTVAIPYDRPGQEEEGTRLLSQTVEDAAPKGGILELQIDRRGQFYCRNFLVPF